MQPIKDAKNQAQPFRVFVVETDEHMRAAYTIRRRVFIEEQAVSEAEEMDGLDEEPTTAHLLAVDVNGEPCGTARVLYEPAGSSGQQIVHIGRVAILESHRGQGGGVALMEAAHELLKSELPPGKTYRVELSVQEHAIGFYQRLGYEISANRYLDARIWHRDAHLILGTEAKN